MSNSSFFRLSPQVIGIVGASILTFVVGVNSVWAQRPTASAVPSPSPTASPALAMASPADGPHFRFGENVTLTEDLTGDVYVGGGKVRVDGNITGDLLVAGGTVEINGNVSEDLRVAGGTLVVNGSVGQDISAAGGTITFNEASQVGGSVVAAGGTVSANGQVQGNVWLGSGTVDLAGSMDRNVSIEAGQLSLLPSAVIGGSLTAQVEEQPSGLDQALVQGEKQVTVRQTDEKARQYREQAQAFMPMAMLTKLVMGIIIALVSASLMLYFFPKPAQVVSATVLNQPFAAFIFGLLYVVATPLVVIVLMITVVGLPIAGLVLLGFLIDLILAGWVSSYALGQVLSDRLKLDRSTLKSPYAQLALGLVVLKTAALIPVLGMAVQVISFFIGMGALFMWFKGLVEHRISRK